MKMSIWRARALAAGLCALLFGAGDALAQGSPSKCAVQPSFVGCYPPSLDFGRTAVVPLSKGDALYTASITTILSKMLALDVTTALGYTPYSAANPSGYQTAAQVAAAVAAGGGSGGGGTTYTGSGAIVVSGTTISVTTGSAAGTVAAGNDARFATFAPLASPTFTGTVTIPAGAAVSGYAPLASPALTGTPTVPTAAAGTSNTQAASTAFVAGAVAAVPSGSSLASFTVYTASGAMDPMVGSALINSSAQCDMTLADGTVDNQLFEMKRYGAGVVTLTARLDGAVGAVVAANSTTYKENIMLRWTTKVTPATWTVR